MFLRRSYPSHLSRSALPPLIRLNSTAPIPPITKPESPEEPPRPSYFTRQTLYPILFLTLFTSLAINLSYGRAHHIEEASILRAQISVLSSLRSRLNDSRERRGLGRGMIGLSSDELEGVERELEMVGLGRAKGRVLREGEEGSEQSTTSWREVFLGKKGKEWNKSRNGNENENVKEEEDVDWAKLVREAEAADLARSRPRNTVIAPPPAQPSKEASKESTKKTLATFL